MLYNRAVKVKPLQNYLIVVRFADGEDKVYNCYPLLQKKIYAELENPEFFNKVHVDDMGLVCWDDATDIEPNELYDNSVSISNFAV